MSCVKTMATVIERPGEAAFREVTLTPKREDTVVCKTLMSAISTGTDMKTYHGMQHPEQSPVTKTSASSLRKALMLPVSKKATAS